MDLTNFLDLLNIFRWNTMVFIELWKKRATFKKFFFLCTIRKCGCSRRYWCRDKRTPWRNIVDVFDDSKKLPISFEELKLEEMIQRQTLEKMFEDAESLLNVRDGFTTAASNDDIARTVKCIISSYPLIVAPNKKNRNVLECIYKSYTWYNLCSHTVAVACDTRICFDFSQKSKIKSI